MKKLVVSLLFISLCSSLFAQPAKKGDVIFASNFNSDSSRAQWSKLSKANWVKAGIAGNTCLLINGEGMVNTTVNLSPYKRMVLRVRCLVKAEGVTKPAQPYQGIKVMLHYKTTTAEFYKNEYNIYGDFNWKPLTFLVSVPYDLTTSDLFLGVQGCTGKVWFDSLSITVVKSPLFQTKQGMDASNNKTQLRGVMSSRAFQKGDFEIVGKEWNANLIRWQLTLNKAEIKMSNNNMDAYDRCISTKLDVMEADLVFCKQYGLKVIIDLHSSPGGQDSAGVHRMFYEKKFNDHFIVVWQQIAQRFKNNPTVLGYDLINEPNEGNLSLSDEMDKNGSQVKAAKAIRKIDQDKTIFIEAGLGDIPEGFRINSPVDFSNIVYEVHMYNPITFTHQGIYSNHTGITYPGIIDGKYYDKNTLREILKPVRDFQLTFHVPIYVGEFSAVRWAPGAAQYLSDCIDLFEEYGWNWTYHAFREWPGWDVEYQNGKSKEEPLKKASQDTDRKKVLLKWFAKNQH